MAKDSKKEDFYHTRETQYQDWEGNWKNFSIVDHDKKPTTAKASKGKSHDTIRREEEEALLVRSQIKSYNEQKIEEILLFPAIFAAKSSDDFIEAHLFSEIVSKEEGEVHWDNTFLREICSLDEGFTSKLHKRLWEHYIKPEYIHEQLTHEEMIEGKWKAWL